MTAPQRPASNSDARKREATRGARLPHRWPGLPADGDAECIAWRCAACGEWISEYRPASEQPGCTVDWRRAP